MWWAPGESYVICLTFSHSIINNTNPIMFGWHLRFHFLFSTFPHIPWDLGQQFKCFSCNNNVPNIWVSSNTLRVKLLGTDLNSDGWNIYLNTPCCSGRKEMFYLKTHATHFIYGYMALDMVEGRKECFYLTTHSTHFIYGYMRQIS